MENKKISDAVCRMIEVMRMHRSLAAERVQSLYPHRTAHMVLMHLSRTENCSSQRELAQRFRVTPAAMTGILKKLEIDGYICRKSGIDTRNNVISITERGVDIVERSTEVFSMLDEQLLSGFKVEEIELLISYLNRMKSNVEKNESKGDIL